MESSFSSYADPVAVRYSGRLTRILERYYEIIPESLGNLLLWKSFGAFLDSVTEDPFIQRCLKTASPPPEECSMDPDIYGVLRDEWLRVDQEMQTSGDPSGHMLSNFFDLDTEIPDMGNLSPSEQGVVYMVRRMASGFRKTE